MTNSQFRAHETWHMFDKAHYLQIANINKSDMNT